MFWVVTSNDLGSAITDKSDEHGDGKFEVPRRWNMSSYTKAGCDVV